MGVRGPGTPWCIKRKNHMKSCGLPMNLYRAENVTDAISGIRVRVLPGEAAYFRWDLTPLRLTRSLLSRSEEETHGIYSMIEFLYVKRWQCGQDK